MSLVALALLLLLFYSPSISSSNKSLTEVLCQHNNKACNGEDWAGIGFFIEGDEDWTEVGFFVEG